MHQISTMSYRSSAAITSVSMHGDTIVCGVVDGTVLQYQNMGKYLKFVRQIKAHMTPGVSYSVDTVVTNGEYIISGAYDNRVKIWNSDGELEITLQEHQRGVKALALEGNTIISGSLDSTIKIWESRFYIFPFRRLFQRLRPQSMAEVDKVFDDISTETRDGKYAVYAKVKEYFEQFAGIDTDVLKLFYLYTMQCHKTIQLDSRGYSIHTIALQGNTVFCGARDITLWNRYTGTLQSVFDTRNSVDGYLDNGYMTGAAFYGDIIVCASHLKQNILQVWDRNTGECVKTIKNEINDKAVTSIAVQGDTIISTSGINIKKWNLQTGECVNTKSIYGNISCVALQGNTFITGSGGIAGGYTESLKVWNLETCETTPTLAGYTSRVKYIAMDSKIIASVSEFEIDLWDRKTGEHIRALEGHSDTITCMVFDGENVISGSSDQSIRIWNKNTGECINILGSISRESDDMWSEEIEETGHSGYITSIAVSGNTIVSGSYDKTVKIWNRTTGKYEATLEHSGLIRCVGIYENDIVSVCEKDNTPLMKRTIMSLWNRTKLEKIPSKTLTVPNGYCSIAIDKNSIIVGTKNNSMHQYRRNLDFVRFLSRTGNSRGWIRSVTIFKDFIVSASESGTVEVWSKSTHKWMETIDMGNEARSIAVDGTTIAIGLAGSLYQCPPDYRSIVVKKMWHFSYPFMTGFDQLTNYDIEVGEDSECLNLDITAYDKVPGSLSKAQWDEENSYDAEEYPGLNAFDRSLKKIKDWNAYKSPGNVHPLFLNVTVYKTGEYIVEKLGGGNLAGVVDLQNIRKYTNIVELIHGIYSAYDSKYHSIESRLRNVQDKINRLEAPGKRKRSEELLLKTLKIDMRKLEIQLGRNGEPNATAGKRKRDMLRLRF